MNEKMILFLDIDDTLLTKDCTVTEENMAAIQDAIDAGHHVVICSGRPLCGVMPVAKQLDFLRPGFFLIAFNGALVYDCGSGETVFYRSLPYEDVHYLFAKAKEQGLHIQTYSKTHLLLPAMTEEARFYLGRVAIDYRIVPELPDGLEEEPPKALLVELHDRSRLDRFREEAAQALKGRASLFYSSQYLLECVREGISKGDAVRWLCNYLGIPIENSIAAGDSENDIPMIEAAHVGCAMKNATQACKNAADYITEHDCDHSGVAEIIMKFMLGKSE